MRETKMFLHYVRYRVLVFIVFMLCCKVSESTKPIISPNREEIVLNEGESLEITCMGLKPLKFIYPDTSNKEAINTSTPSISEGEENLFYKYIFQRSKTIFGDTGWYGCADYNVEVSNFFDNSEVNWLYVYVKSDSNLFVEADTFAHLNAVAGDSTVIPCRPTSPDLVPVLSNNNEDELEGKASFDPKIGFTIKNLTVKDSDWYKCSIKKDNEEHEVNYVLSVHLRQTLPEPKIHDDTLRHVTRGQDLYVNCTVEVDASVRYVFNWSTPQSNSRVSTQQFRKQLDGNYLLATCQLTVFNVTDEDAGEYKCIIRSIHDTKNTTKNIKIHDPQIKYINLTSQHIERYYQGEKGSNVQWVVYIDGFPKPHLQWFEPKGHEITPSPKYSVNTSATITILRINNLGITDAGEYILEAKNDYMIKKLNFTLDVIAKPVAILTEIESYYAPNETAEFRCEVLSHPTSNVTWNFLKCPNYPSFENSTIVELTDVMENVYSNYKYESRAKMPIEVSGILTCKACNSLDCDIVMENILVSDGMGAFGIIGPKELVTKDDTVELICAASVYNYTDELRWTKLENETEMPVIETDRLEIKHYRTPFTYRSTLKIHHVQESDAEDYICTGKCTNEFNHLDPGQRPALSDYASYKLIIHDPVSPFFIKTNMNETIVKNIDIIAEGHKTLILECFVDGKPKPIITWYKDNTLLVENDQYLFKFNYQELNIKYFKEYDSGKYSCHAINRLGTSETYQEIMVKNAKLQKLDVILAVSIAILGVVLVILAIIFTIKVRREKKMRKELMEAGLMHFEEGALECLNPDLTVDDQAELLPYDKKWEFPRERLKLGKQLGSGAFGVVMKAEAQGICETETVTTVAVKMVRRTTDPTYVRALASELKIMVHLGKHLNVVNLLGACTKNISKRELLVIVEYCRFGNLHNYLLKHRGSFVNQIDPNTGKLDLTIGMDILTRTASVSSNNRIKYAALSFSRSLSANSGTDTVVHYCPGTSSDIQEINFSPDGCVLSNNSSQPEWRTNYRGDYKDQNLKPICTQDLLSYAFQVARGMEYLSQRRVLHGDLAARNILLCENNIVKICDFGLAKTMYKDDNYKKKGDGPLPIKWMAIESIRDRIFSTQSDIWSFGIVLWEFFTLSETPYPSMEAEKLYQKLIEGYRMEQPEYAIREIYEIMSQCWKAKPTLRPSFTDLVESIGNLLEESVRSHYISLNTPYMDMNTMILESGKNDYLTMMSAPDHGALSSPEHNYANSPFSEGAPDSSYLCMSPGYQTNESGIFSPRPHEDRSHFEFPSPASDSEDAVELSPMLKKEEDPYLKPINVQERRAEFARQREAMKNQMAERSIDRDSGYCNAPRNLHLIDYLNDVDKNDAIQRADAESKKDYAPSIISTQDNYVNMPKQKSDLRLGIPDGFSNPSYVMMNTREMDQRA